MFSRCASSALATAILALASNSAHASLLPPEMEDSVANAISWVALIIAPAVAIGLFWIVHIMPEKIAEKRRHPQAKAIQALCLLSLFFGGLLWPLAWLWAYTKPVLHKLAYGTDTDEHDTAMPASIQTAPAPAEVLSGEVPMHDGDQARLEELKRELASLESRIAKTQPRQESR